MIFILFSNIYWDWNAPEGSLDFFHFCDIWINIFGPASPWLQGLNNKTTASSARSPSTPTCEYIFQPLCLLFTNCLLPENLSAQSQPLAFGLAWELDYYPHARDAATCMAHLCAHTCGSVDKTQANPWLLSLPLTLFLIKIPSLPSFQCSDKSSLKLKMIQKQSRAKLNPLLPLCNSKFHNNLCQ